MATMLNFKMKKIYDDVLTAGAEVKIPTKLCSNWTRCFEVITIFVNLSRVPAAVLNFKMLFDPRVVCGVPSQSRLVKILSELLNFV